MNIEVVAEIAQGFEGRLDQATLLLRAAAFAGADCAKFQLVYADELATEDYEHYRLFRELEMPDEAWFNIAERASELQVRLAFDVFGLRSLALAEAVGADSVKLHPTDISNDGIVHAVARSSIGRVILGAGGACATELDRAIQSLSTKKIVVMLGFQGYPTRTEDNQISRVGVIAERYQQLGNVGVGFADHAPLSCPLRYALAATAVGAGAIVIEKHLSLGAALKLEDHESALNPDEFTEFCATLRACGQAIGRPSGDDDFGMSASEQDYRHKIRRHVVALRDLSAGDCVSPLDVGLKRTSASSVLLDVASAYGQILNRSIRANTPVPPTALT
jgi:sialic acid synthase SpsE